MRRAPILTATIQFRGANYRIVVQCQPRPWYEGATESTCTFLEVTYGSHVRLGKDRDGGTCSSLARSVTLDVINARAIADLLRQEVERRSEIESYRTDPQQH